MRLRGTVLGSLGRFTGLVVLPARKGVLSCGILREDGFSKSVGSQNFVIYFHLFTAP